MQQKFKVLESYTAGKCFKRTACFTVLILTEHRFYLPDAFAGPFSGAEEVSIFSAEDFVKSFLSKGESVGTGVAAGPSPGDVPLPGETESTTMGVASSGASDSKSDSEIK